MDGEDKFSQRIDINETENIPAKTLHFVGLMLFRGDGVPQNYAEAAKWFSGTHQHLHAVFAESHDGQL